MSRLEEGGVDDVWTDRIEAWMPQGDDRRSAYASDLERVLHSRSFRSLQGKTQVLSPERSGLHRTRMTHTLEVADTAVRIMHQIAGDPDSDLLAGAAHLPPSDLLRTIALAHDIGHPPFGHDGEKALDACMAPYGGFEANAQTLRIVSRLESSSRNAGLNLTRRAMLGVLKYPAPANRVGQTGTLPRKGCFDAEVDVVDWILAPLSRRDRNLFTSVEARGGRPARTLHKSLDCSLMDVADDIAYGVHDLEDALALGLVDEAAFRRHVPPDVCLGHLERLGRGYAQEGGTQGYERLVAMLFGSHGDRRRASSRIAGTLIVTASIETVDGFDEPLLRYSVGLPPSARAFLDALHALVRETVIRGPEVGAAAGKNMAMVAAVFDGAMRGAIALPILPHEQGGSATDRSARMVCDRIAALTDRRLFELHRLLR